MKTRIRYKLLSPLSHIGETASTGTVFQTVLTQTGRVPVITGNSIRGQLRDSIAEDLLERIGQKVNKEVFNVLFSGGNLNGSMKEDMGKARQVREHFPAVSLLGSGLGDMIMAGKMISGFAYPVCKETGEITGEWSDISWHSLVDEIEFTRMDDAKNDVKGAWITNSGEELRAKASTQMRYSVQYIAAGAEFVQDVAFLNGVTDLEMGAFYAGLAKWFETPRLGGMASKGFGLFDAVVGEDDVVLEHGKITVSERARVLIDGYAEFVAEEGGEWLGLLDSGKKEAKGRGKKTDGADQSNGVA